MAQSISRRTFLGTAVGAAGMLAGKWESSAQVAESVAASPWIEATIPQLQRLMRARELTSRQLTLAYLDRINRLDRLLGSLIETNPHAVAIAARRDNERREGRLRGPLHGIPVLVKDNIATDDHMETTAGSLALVGSRVPRDAKIVWRLRRAGAVILGKANLSEWANARGFGSINGWSARGGFTRNPYILGFDPSGSSSGSAVAVAANLCAAAVGTETDGSILSPAGNNLVVGMKPTRGLVAQEGIIPIAHSQDTAGPIARTVVDAAILLGILQSPFDDVAGRALPDDYRGFLRRGALKGARIGVDRRFFAPAYGGVPEINAVVERALGAMEALGSTVVDTDTGDSLAYSFAEGTVLISELKVHLAEYLAGLDRTRIRTLADVISFNQVHCREEMKYFGQEVFELSEATSGDLMDPAYLEARALCLQLSRAEGIDAAIERDRLDAIVAPSLSFATTPAAVAGYPSISLPVGLTDGGVPAGIWMYAGFLQEPKLLAFAYDLEQELQARTMPTFQGSVPPEPPDAGICAAARPSLDRIADLHHFGRGKRL